MPKLIIKRETSEHFTRQAILFWVLGLLPAALLAGFLTGNVISHLRHTKFKAGQVPLLPLAPTVAPQQQLPNSQALKLLLAPIPELPANAHTELEQLNNTDLKPSSTPSSKHSQPVKPIEKQAPPQAVKKPSASPSTTNKSTESIEVIHRASTNDQPNHRSYPAITPRPSNKLIKSPQTVSESPRATKTVSRTQTNRHAHKPAKPPASPTEPERGNDPDYRLLEQSLGIPLQ